MQVTGIMNRAEDIVIEIACLPILCRNVGPIPTGIFGLTSRHPNFFTAYWGSLHRNCDQTWLSDHGGPKDTRGMKKVGNVLDDLANSH